MRGILLAPQRASSVDVLRRFTAKLPSLGKLSVLVASKAHHTQPMHSFVGWRASPWLPSRSDVSLSCMGKTARPGRFPAAITASLFFSFFSSALPISPLRMLALVNMDYVASFVRGRGRLDSVLRPAIQPIMTADHILYDPVVPTSPTNHFRSTMKLQTSANKSAATHARVH